MKELIITNKILNWYDIHKRTLPWRKKISLNKKQYYTLVSEFMLQQTQVATVIPYFNRFIKNIPNLKVLAQYDDQKLIKLWEGLGYYSRVKNLKKTAQIIIKDFNKSLPDNLLDLKSLPGIGDYTASAIMAIAFNKRIIPLDGNIERVLKRYLYLKNENQIHKDNLIKQKKIFGTSLRSSDYAQALMELGALICKPINPYCERCPISGRCKSFKKKDFVLTKSKKDNKEKYYLLKVYKKDKKYLLVKNKNFNFLKNLDIFPMQEIIKPKNFNHNLNFKMSNMNMNIKIQTNKVNKLMPFSYWIDPKKLKKYTLPTFTKKIVSYLENHS
ncbi:A/G-specific adenine glycosylase [Candidatus Pelagibacter sp.]|nr:A/G-specific adenine glycosylase [Candidatus Pelagibacter sp.]MDC0901259.1 A/G-specific adenine glycosylase [Candidatus Pelagibacter sp.]MDC1069669.1 A/G-specific adenine glycosylase [Candidatus Pelagibacter sp.]